MHKVSSFVFFVLIYLKFALSFSPSKIYPPRIALLSSSQDFADVGEPLILSPLILEGKLDEARKLSRVQNLTDVVSYSGYLTVNQKYNSNLFFWFFPAAFNPETAPVLLWLQGGPGGSSLFGLFVENGPFKVDVDNIISLRSTAWTLTHSVIYIDNPVGTGFSFSDDDRGYATTEEDVARDLYSALTQFYTLFPQYADRDFYLTGESYAGKYLPAIGYKIHTENRKSPQLKINLKGLAIGDGFSDPVNMLNYGTYLRSIGLIDDTEMKHFHQEEHAARVAILNKDFSKANQIIDQLMDGDVTGVPYFTNVTGFTFYFNYLMPQPPPDHSYYSPFLQQSYIRKSIHVGNISYSEDSRVEKHLENDMYQSVIGWIEELLDVEENYRVLLYSGQLDIIVAHTNTEQMLRRMKWSGAEEYAKAEKKKYKVGKDLAGYVKTTKNLTYLIIRNAGHILPYDQPKWSFDMINRFTHGKPYSYN